MSRHYRRQGHEGAVKAEADGQVAEHQAEEGHQSTVRRGGGYVVLELGLGGEALSVSGRRSMEHTRTTAMKRNSKTV